MAAEVEAQPLVALHLRVEKETLKDLEPTIELVGTISEISGTKDRGIEKYTIMT